MDGASMYSSHPPVSNIRFVQQTNNFSSRWSQVAGKMILLTGFKVCLGSQKIGKIHDYLSGFPHASGVRTTVKIWDIALVRFMVNVVRIWS
ncbi:hypothetical protein PoB_000454600 [Plakobranchus ocellatus]|uniref:Uncharacterized protein n=1 Tax=Plakobranchus ocellatus TaxID=259542 RepID=A0AAV3Y6J5_9GAST|nr:hypothetical protein PoB_000454600 [Plakobranchus ocellatus]